jgi:aspartate/tyrosine/aromatic aminotransferase
VKGRGSKIYLPSPTWANHMNIFRHAGLVPEMYDYYDPGLGTFNLEKMLSSVEKADEGSLFLMHSCAHNPTGCDPSLEQWDIIREALQKKNHYTLFDNAYQVPSLAPSRVSSSLLLTGCQGYATGDSERDATVIRRFAEAGVQLAVCNSYSKVTLPPPPPPAPPSTAHS